MPQVHGGSGFTYTLKTFIGQLSHTRTSTARRLAECIDWCGASRQEGDTKSVGVWGCAEERGGEDGYGLKRQQRRPGQEPA